MKTALFLLCLWCTQAMAQTPPNWFTVLGDRADPTLNTIEVDPAPLENSDAGRIMNIRVSRSAQRTSWDGVPYRSYNARVMFNCTEGKAYYLSLTFYNQPLWQGASHRTSTYTPDNPRPMLFLDVEPNPTQRIIKAACI
ncbi:MAG: surface-adhesin E family protein [Ramlibacter sp.]